jgi:hypothetical protein
MKSQLFLKSNVCLFFVFIIVLFEQLCLAKIIVAQEIGNKVLLLSPSIL